MKPVIDVCISTYKRTDQLEKLLHSLIGQETGGRFDFAIHVADNDALGTAEPVVRRFQSAGHPISYGIEPEQNISMARNKSVSFARGDYVAVTDDDQYADPRWLLSLYEAAVTHEADVVHGNVVPSFPDSAPRFVRDFHTRQKRLTGVTRGYVYSTANVLFRRSLIAGNSTPFDPRLGRSGGEDSAFFNALHDSNRRMIWCAEAIVHSVIPPDRCTLRWILKRRFRVGYTVAAIRKQPQSVVPIFVTIARLLPRVAVFSILGIFHRPSRQKAVQRSVSLLLNIAFLLGRLVRGLGIEYAEYKG